MTRKKYQAPSFGIMDDLPGGGDDPVIIIGSGQDPLNPANASYGNWRLAVQEAHLDIDQSYEGYLEWMAKNGYGAYIHEEES